MDKAALLKDLRKQVTALEDDLRARTDSEDEFRVALEREYKAAREAQRTAATYGAWRDERVTQAAAAWILATVFVRFCEDNGLITDPYIAGPGEQLADAEDRQAAFFRERPELNDRDWLVAGFEALAGSHEAVAGLFDRGHNPLWELTPSYEAATRLLGFWRERGADGEIVHVFADDELDTRFLGDLYQDLSEHARKTYALLQTPEFVEEFILDLTLEPAVEEFGLDPVWKHKPKGWQGTDPIARGLRCIDPACGSGHFLLGMFGRLLEKWRAAEPGTDDWELVRRSLESVHGCDKNPFAVAIARFRLLVAALKACGERRLSAAPAFPINVAVGDSLLHGRGAESVTETLDTLFGGGDEGMFAYRTEDVREYAERVDLLGRGTYHVVVGNPPYIEVSDEQEIKNYRAAYVCSNKFPLSVPFAQRLFELAVRSNVLEVQGGRVGQITSNSFMKRNSGKRLIEEFFPGVSLSHIIDVSRAHIPGHNREGTPTVVLVGENRIPSRRTSVRMVTGLKGGDGSAGDGPIHQRQPWLSIADQANGIGDAEDGWSAAGEVPRDYLAKHPWMLPGGGREQLRSTLANGSTPLKSIIEPPIGRAVRVGADAAFVRPLHCIGRGEANAKFLRGFLTGRSVRDWSAVGAEGILYPYAGEASPEVLARELWPWRTLLAARRTFKGDMADAGLEWWEYMQHTESAYATPLSITFAFKASHNHFSLDRGGNVFNRHAPIIKLTSSADLRAHYSLLAVLNSSVSCFLMREAAQHQGGGSAGHPWSWTMEFTGGIVQNLPIPDGSFDSFGEELDELSRTLLSHEPANVLNSGMPSRQRMEAARAEDEQTRANMIGLQEELDWVVYGAHGLLDRAEIARTLLPDGIEPPRVALGQRAFEIVLARKEGDGETSSGWFNRSDVIRSTEIPDDWSDQYKAIVQARIDVINSRRDIALIERPECKRRWESRRWEDREKEALKSWLLNACERRDLWFHLRDGFPSPRTLSVNQLADALRSDPEVSVVAELYAEHSGSRDVTLVDILADVLDVEHVPYLAALRYTDSGLRKHAQWRDVWIRQRREDEGVSPSDISVPPEYVNSGSRLDFLKASYWSHRGKLDVPKERFISYPDASPDSDPTILLGWAGWDHKDQVQALVNVINDRTEQAGWDTPRLTPLIAGIQELMPWVHQWHGEHDEEWGGTPSEEYQAYLDEQRAKHGLSVEGLTAWRPEKKKGGRAKKAD
ncbi:MULTISPECIES: BREX-2 system adenine-specific DNA-methyltransferase PglX [Streptomyces]|uniref:BREX-2 system adenine-specific DNA-methyltransferase PglX n=1 Tax=Streptomyces TaxID=1883 RepID=UPI000A7E016B|nr:MULTISPECIES: BREX-2 system adenine-specific DNA-methyltransferase PglX [Streptomyces]